MANVVDRVAVALCNEYGLDATREIVCGRMAALTPSEAIAKGGSGRNENPSIIAAQWQLFRGEAALLLAHRAINRRLDDAREKREAQEGAEPQAS